MRYFPYRRATEVTGANLNSLFPERATLKGPKLISFDLEKFFVANVDNHFRDIAEIRDEFPFDVFVCDGALYAEKLVAEVLGVPVFAVGLSMVMPRRPGSATLLRPPAGPDHGGQDRASRRAAHAREHHAGGRAARTTRSSPATASRRSRSTGSHTRRWPAPAGCS